MMLYLAAEVPMRTIAIAIALLLGLAGAGTASAASRHGKRHHARSAKHAKLKSSRHGKRA
ncbi:MAG: hypothetical protein LC659_08385 [Myxococcales bacterium]|nr:hypothetical protein [Myxococcales bacterium]